MTLHQGEAIQPRMGLLSKIGIGGTPEEKIERHLKKVKQAYAQPDYRRAAMEALLSMGTPDAYFALCRRFGVIANNSYWDEEEKRWLVDTFIALGEPAIAPLKRFVKEVDAVNYPIRALQGLLPKEQMTEFLLEALQARSPDDYRSAQGKMEIIDHIGQLEQAPHLVEAIKPYLRDHSDDVIYKTIEVLEDWKVDDLAELIFALVYDETMSARVQRRAAQQVVSLNLQSEENLEQLPDAVAEDFRIEGHSLASKRAKAS